MNKSHPSEIQSVALLSPYSFFDAKPAQLDRRKFKRRSFDCKLKPIELLIELLDLAGALVLWAEGWLIYGPREFRPYFP